MAYLLDAFVVWSLYLFCIFHKSVYVLFEVLFESFRIVVFRYLLAIRIRCATHRQILKIGLPAFLFVFVVIFDPCLVEASRQEERKMVFEFVDGNFDSRKFLFQNMNDSHAFFGPFSRSGIYPFKLGIYGISKLTSSVKIAFYAEDKQVSDIAKKAKDNDRGPWWQGEVTCNDAWHYFLIIIVVEYFLVWKILPKFDKWLFRDIRTFWRSR